MRKYLYIDGGSFEACMQDLVDSILPGKDIWEVIDVGSFHHGYDRVFYYDSLPVQGKLLKAEFDKKRAEKEALFDRINSTYNCHVHTGEMKYRKRAETRMEQKGVDVMLAIQVVQHAYQGSVDEAHVFTSDLDFFPMFDALISTKVNSRLIYRPGHTSKELIHSADLATPMTIEGLYKWMYQQFRELHHLRSGGNRHPGTGFTAEVVVPTADGRSWRIGPVGDASKNYVAVADDAEATHYTAGSTEFLRELVKSRYGASQGTDGGQKVEITEGNRGALQS